MESLWSERKLLSLQLVQTLSENRQVRVKITWKNLEALLAFCGFLRSVSDMIKQTRDCCRSRQK